MKIATWNVNSVNVRLPQLIDWLAAATPDVVCLQETKTIDDGFPAEQLAAAGYSAVFTGEKAYNGVAIISKLPITDAQMNFPDDGPDAPKRLVAATIGGIRVVNTYVPNGSELGSDKFRFKLDWLVRLRRYLDATCAENGDVIWCGDFNVAPDAIDVWDPAAYEGRLHFTRAERAAVHYVKQWGLVDLFRQLGPERREFSWWDYRAGAWQRDHGLRIDHLFASHTLAARCLSCVIDRRPRELTLPSDHTPVIADFKP